MLVVLAVASLSYLKPKLELRRRILDGLFSFFSLLVTVRSAWWLAGASPSPSSSILVSSLQPRKAIRIPRAAPTQTSAAWCLLSVIRLMEEVAAIRTSKSCSQNLSSTDWVGVRRSWR